MNYSIIAIDDEEIFLRSIRRGLLAEGFRRIHLESDPQKALSLFGNGSTFDIALIDVRMPDMSGVQVLEAIKSKSPSTECIMITAVKEVATAVECIRKGAYDYLTKPFLREDLIIKIKNVLEKKRLMDIASLSRHPDAGLTNPAHFQKIITASPTMINLLREAELHARSDIPVLITGESGTGKELLAHAIHNASDRSAFPYLAVNVSAIPEHLFDAEFFGSVRGAFTGADKSRPGYLESALRGTLLLDEIGIMPFDIQSKLLRVLQEREYRRLGSDTTLKVDVRIIATTNEDLERLVQEGRFRKDLFYRLKGAWLQLPPLRERIEDVPLLIRGFLGRGTRGNGKIGIEEAAMAAFMAYDYPGNVRELQNLVAFARNLSRGKTITASALPKDLKAGKTILKNISLGNPETDLPLSEVEKNHILKVYKATGRNKSQTARTLGIALNTLRSRLSAYGVD